MTPSELKCNVEQTGSNYFTRSSMKFFGDTMANYGCRDAGGCWELWRKRPVKNGHQTSAYFNKKTFAKQSEPTPRIHTRAEHMAGECSHDEFYGQFVTSSQLSMVESAIGLKRLLASEDTAYNDIPLKEWDRIGLSGSSISLMKQADISYSLANACCTNKAAARQLITNSTEAGQ